jgi:hypothetical protein
MRPLDESSYCYFSYKKIKKKIVVRVRYLGVAASPATGDGEGRYTRGIGRLAAVE